MKLFKKNKTYWTLILLMAVTGCQTPQKLDSPPKAVTDPKDKIVIVLSQDSGGNISGKASIPDHDLLSDSGHPGKAPKILQFIISPTNLVTVDHVNLIFPRIDGTTKTSTRCSREKIRPWHKDNIKEEFPLRGRFIFNLRRHMKNDNPGSDDCFFYELEIVTDTGAKILVDPWLRIRY